MVNTVLGAKRPQELGKTLMHEHIVYGYPGWVADETIAPFDREAVIKVSLKTMGDLKAHGVRTFVDATPNDCGRDPLILKEISERSGMDIVACTGLFNEAMGGAPYFKFRGSASALDIIKEIEDIFVTEITKGIGKTGVKAGVIKVATGFGHISPYEERVVRAAGRAQKATGVPIITHTEAGTLGPEQADILISEGANPNQVMIGHAGGSQDIRYHETILNKGVYLGFDRFGFNLPPGDNPLESGISGVMMDHWRIACIVGLISMGWVNKLIMSNDSLMPGGFLGRSPEAVFPVPSQGPQHIFLNIVPALVKARLTNAEINTILVENPRRLFTGESS